MFYPPHEYNRHYFHPYEHPQRRRRVRHSMRPPFQNHPMQSGLPYTHGGRPSIIKSAFIDENGQFDVGRTLQTVDQVVKTVHQVTPLVRQVSSMFLRK